MSQYLIKKKLLTRLLKQIHETTSIINRSLTVSDIKTRFYRIVSVEKGAYVHKSVTFFIIQNSSSLVALALWPNCTIIKRPIGHVTWQKVSHFFILSVETYNSFLQKCKLNPFVFATNFSSCDVECAILNFLLTTPV